MIKAVQQFMLGTVTNNEKQAMETLSAIKAAGYDGIELCGFIIRPTPLIVQLLTQAAGMPTGRGGKLNWLHMTNEAGLSVVSIHEDLDHIEKEPQAIVDEARHYHTDTIVVTGMYRFDYRSEQAVRHLAARLNQAGKMLAEQKIRLLYHNHNVELLHISAAQCAWDILLNETDPACVNFEFDSYWYTEAGGDAQAMMRRLGSRMKLWHINDRGTKQRSIPMTPIIKSDSMELGTGNMPLDALCDTAKLIGIDAVILESHRNWIDHSPVRSLQVSAEYLNRQF
ncbi:MAG: sugar phosphate isomerase [Faecalibacterium sp. CAG:74_58_120]|nr:MAG: sugar phosphate isomerase [Faecalibacterium sp. CAG:74_58_120]